MNNSLLLKAEVLLFVSILKKFWFLSLVSGPDAGGKNRLNTKRYRGGLIAKVAKNCQKGTRIKFGYLKRYTYICTRKSKKEEGWDDKVPFLF